MEIAALVEGQLPPTPASVLEIGCGEGELARAVARLGYEIIAIDPQAPDGEIFEPVSRAPNVGVYRFWRDMGYVAGDFSQESPPTRSATAGLLRSSLASPRRRDSGSRSTCARASVGRHWRHPLMPPRTSSPPPADLPSATPGSRRLRPSRPARTA